LAAKSVPVMPPAPARFSATTGCPSISDSFCATTRPTRSVACPGGHGMTMRKGRFGYAGCASAAPHSVSKARKVLILRIIDVSVVEYHGPDDALNGRAPGNRHGAPATA